MEVYRANAPQGQAVAEWVLEVKLEKDGFRTTHDLTRRSRNQKRLRLRRERSAFSNQLSASEQEKWRTFYCFQILCPFWCQFHFQETNVDPVPGLEV